MKFQYHYQNFLTDINHPEEYLNKMGAEGWELVAIIPKYGYESIKYIFKKPLTS
jgi:hypothetical protein